MAATAAPASKLAAPAPKSSEVGFWPAHVRSSRRQPQSSPRGKCQCRILRPQLTSFEVTPPQCRRSPRCRCDIVAVEVRRSVPAHGDAHCQDTSSSSMQRHLRRIRGSHNDGRRGGSTEHEPIGGHTAIHRRSSDEKYLILSKSDCNPTSIDSLCHRSVNRGQMPPWDTFL